MQKLKRADNSDLCLYFFRNVNKNNKKDVYIFLFYKYVITT